MALLKRCEYFACFIFKLKLKLSLIYAAINLIKLKLPRVYAATNKKIKLSRIYAVINQVKAARRHWSAGGLMIFDGLLCLCVVYICLYLIIC